MPLAPGTRLGPYEILAPLGAGGMGEVYRAHDKRLRRDVAIKVLPDDVAGDPRALARFEREARAAAALSHPNILALFDVGQESGIRYCVTELLEGGTLREVIRSGAMPPRRALDISEQIARGLAAAHEKGLVHRDVKPENIFITKDGGAKLLDFGLARYTAPTTDPSDTHASTLTALTERGVVAGTTAYMSPEQAQGLTVDHRSDQFSFGVVLYEMLAGTRPFRGESAAETLTAIIRHAHEPLEKRAPGVPAPMRWVVDRLLAKEPSRRYDSTRDLALDLATFRLHISEVMSPGLSDPEGAALPLLRRPALAQIGALLGIVIVVLGAGVTLGRLTGGPSSTVTTPAPTFQRLTTFDGIETWPTISPDGKNVAYQKTVGGKSDVYVLRVGGTNPTNLTASLEGDCSEPAFSPDGRLIAFRSESDNGGIFLMGATGESVRRLTDFGHTPAWFPDGKRIVLATQTQTDPSSVNDSQLWIVDLESAARRRVLKSERVFQPSVSPHGLRIAFWGLPSGGGQRDIYTTEVGDAEDEPATAVTDDAALDWSPFWSADGRFLYFASNRNGSMNLWRVGIEEASGKVHGLPEPITVPVSWAGPFGTTPDGSRVVFTSTEPEVTLERIPFDPVTEEASGPAVRLGRFVNGIETMRVSPGGDLLTFRDKSDIVVLKTDGTGLRKLTDDAYHDFDPSFSPDGRAIAFHSDRAGPYDIWGIAVDGSGLTAIIRSENGRSVISPAWSPDGKTIATSLDTRFLMLVPFPRSVDDPLPGPCPTLPGGDQMIGFYSWSPDGRQLAVPSYRADGSVNGVVLYDIEKKAYRRLTETGGTPSFMQDGRRIAFQDRNSLKIVDIATGRAREVLRADPRRVLGTFRLAPNDKSFFVSWESTQADLWLMELPGKT